MKQRNDFQLSLRVICTWGKVLGRGPRTIYRLRIVGHILSNFREPKDRGVRSGHWAFMRQSDRVFIDWGGKGFPGGLSLGGDLWTNPIVRESMSTSWKGACSRLRARAFSTLWPCWGLRIAWVTNRVSLIPLSPLLFLGADRLSPSWWEYRLLGFRNGNASLNFNLDKVPFHPRCYCSEGEGVTPPPHLSFCT